MNPKADFFFAKPGPWQEAYERLRTLVLACGLEETVKWGVPCYTYHGRNVVLIHGFKDYCALLFVRGVLLKDESNILIRQTENVQAARQVRFTSAKDVEKQQSLLRAYIHEAIEVENSGVKVAMKETKEFPMPDELREKLNEDTVLQEAFASLTPGRQRAYLLYFSQAKQSATRAARIEKYRQHILEGKGMND